MSLFTLPNLLDSVRWKNLRVGLLGGSFNPPHEGHVHISLAALKGLKLDAVWWLVTPQNPIKAITPRPFQERIALCKKLATHPRILVSDLEKRLGTATTYDTVCALKKTYQDTNFVWVSGMDNALTLHHWYRWRDLLNEICMVHMTRMPAKSLIQNSPLRMLGFQKHVVITKGASYPLDSGTTYWMLQKKMVNVSSTELREKQDIESMV